MILLGTEDESIVAHLDGTIGNKYTHDDIQNELLNIMSRHVLLSKLETVRKNVFLSIMADEYTDITNKEQFSKLENIKSVTVADAINGILLRCNLSVQNCRGRTMEPAI